MWYRAGMSGEMAENGMAMAKGPAESSAGGSTMAECKGRLRLKSSNGWAMAMYISELYQNVNLDRLTDDEEVDQLE